MDLLAKELQIYWKQNNKNQEGKVIEKIVRAMMNLIACEVCGKELDAQIFSLSDQELARLYQLSKTHDLAHLTGERAYKKRRDPKCRNQDKTRKTTNACSLSL